MKELVQSIRSWKLISSVNYMCYIYERLKNKSVNNNFKELYPDVAVPDPYMVYDTFKLNYQVYYESGKKTAEWIKKEVSRFREIKNWQILDWGCGTGRVIRHMPDVITNDCSFYGCDYNYRHIKWCSAHIKGINFATYDLYPPLLYDYEQFDMIYGISTFTHVSDKKHVEWLEQLLRVLKRGGILLITTNGDANKGRLLPVEREQYKKNMPVIRSNPKEEGHATYKSCQPPAYMKQLFGERLKILSYQLGSKQGNGLKQDVWILEKR